VLKRSISFWLGAAAIGLFLFQALPVVGLLPAFLFLFFSLNVFVVNALLVHAFLIALFVEASMGWAPRALMVVPVLAYGAYYGAYFEQTRIIADETANLEKRNVSKGLDFDPSVMSLVFSHEMDLELFVAHYKVPVAYSQNNSARLIPASQCAAIKSYDNGASARTMTTQYLYPRELVTKETAPCLLFRDEQPANPPVYVRKVEYASAKQESFSVSVLSTEVVFNGKLVGSRESLRVYRIRPYLKFLGCFFGKCGSLFEEDSQTIGPDGPDPAYVDKTLYASPASELLAIPKYTNADIIDFAGYPSNAPIISLAQSPPPLKN
jgi:hypothetical protein